MVTPDNCAGDMERGKSVEPARPRTWAPMTPSGAITRPIGRPRSEPSPVSTLKNGCPARMPVSSLAVVPEFPASITSAGSRKPSRPAPSTSSTASSRVSTPVTGSRRRSSVSSPDDQRRRTRAPSIRIALAVDRQSPPSPAPVRVAVPVAIALSITARCVMLLSPGTVRAPDKCPTACTTRTPPCKPVPPELRTDAGSMVTGCWVPCSALMPRQPSQLLLRYGSHQLRSRGQNVQPPQRPGRLPLRHRQSSR